MKQVIIVGAPAETGAETRDWLRPCKRRLSGLAICVDSAEMMRPKLGLKDHSDVVVITAIHDSGGHVRYSMLR